MVDSAAAQSARSRRSRCVPVKRSTGLTVVITSRAHGCSPSRWSVALAEFVTVRRISWCREVIADVTRDCCKATCRGPLVCRFKRGNDEAARKSGVHSHASRGRSEGAAADGQPATVGQTMVEEVVDYVVTAARPSAIGRTAGCRSAGSRTPEYAMGARAACCRDRLVRRRPSDRAGVLDRGIRVAFLRTGCSCWMWMVDRRCRRLLAQRGHAIRGVPRRTQRGQSDLGRPAVPRRR